ncbi:MAG: TetR/AcrR family transcriptional regulator [Saprospiraceae bacterium]|nr:TetR/AcrR family transcriptional regulator [Pyrinomonadaceae bacterium]
MKSGRPRTFDTEKALDRAMYTFWRKGYYGTSIPDLTRAMSISRPSLYAAFGNKEALFAKVLDRYRSKPAAYLNEAIKEPTAKKVFEKLLLGAIDLQTDPANPGGCLFVQGALASGESNDAIRHELAARRASGEATIKLRFEQAVSEGDLPVGTNPADLAKFAATVVHGLAVQTAGGDEREDLLHVADLALRAFPN